MIVTYEDYQSLRHNHAGGRYCNKGARLFLKMHNLSWHDFKFHGLDSEVLLATQDAQARMLVEHAKQRREESC